MCCYLSSRLRFTAASIPDGRRFRFGTSDEDVADLLWLQIPEQAPGQR